eukprot:scaffold1210_cov123-Skeletonema_menzelii.AAC.1
MSSKQKKNAAAGRRGRGDNGDNDHVERSSHPDTTNTKSPPEDEGKISSTASLDVVVVDNATPAEDNNDNKAPPPQKTDKKQSDPPPAPPQPPPAKIKGRFMEVKMKQLTSYFSSKSTSFASTGGEDKKASSPLVGTSRDRDGGEEHTNTTTNSAGMKRPLTDAGEAEADDDGNLKKRRVINDEGDGDNSDHREINLDEPCANTNSDHDETADTTQDPDVPKRPIGSTDDDEVGESAITLDSNTNGTTAPAATCPLHFLANAVILSPDAKNASSERGNVDVKEESTPMQKIISNLNYEDDECEAKHDDGGKNNKPAAEKVDTSIGESTEGEGGESANGKCPDTTPTTDVEEGDSDQTVKVEVGVPAQQILNEERSSCLNDDSLSKKIEEGESSATPALDNNEIEKPSQSSDTKTTEMTLNEGDATAIDMDIDETRETFSTGQTPQQAEDSTNAVVTDDAPLHQLGVGAAETVSHPELSTSYNNFETSNSTKASTPSVSQLKMALFLEASRVHVGSKPERMFANYWDALEKYIAPRRNRSHFTARSDPSFKFNATLELFLKTRKMKRLHNKLILALISESVKGHVPAHCSGDFIPRVWRNRTPHLHRKSEDGAELDELGSSGGSLRDDWDSSFGNDADAWSPCGNSVTIVPRIDQHDFVAKKHEEREEEVSNEEIIPSCRLPGVVTTGLFVKKIASDAGLTVSHDSMWLLIVAAREYASTIIGRAIDNDKNVTSGQTPRIPKSDYSSLSCEHLRSDKKGGKKKDSKKKDSASRAERSKVIERNESEKKEKKVLNCADISQVLYEQHVAAPRLAWMRSMGGGVAHYKPDLQTTNDIINTSIQRAAIKRRRSADRKVAETLVDVNVAPAAAVEENLQDKSRGNSIVVNESGIEEPERKVEAAIENLPSINMKDSATKAPPKSSDLLKFHAHTTEPKTEASAAPAQSALSPSVDSTPTTPPAPGKVTQIRQISKFGAKNLAAMKAKRRRSGSYNKETELAAGKAETPERLVHYQSQAAKPATQSLPQQPVPASASVSVTNLPAPAPVSRNQSKVETPERLARYQQAAGPVTQTPLQPAPTSVTNLHTPVPVSTYQSKEETDKLALYQQPAGPVTQTPLQQPAPAPTTVTNQIKGLDEREKLIQSQYRQQQHKPNVASNTTQLWQETEMTMQSQVEQDGDEEEALPQLKSASTSNQL